METPQALPEDNPHAWPSVYEPDPVPPATPQPATAPPQPVPGQMAPGTHDASPAKACDGGKTDEAWVAVEAATTPECQGAPSEPGSGQMPSGGKRAYGRASPPAARSVAKILPHADDHDMFPAFMSRSAIFGAIRANLGGPHNGPLRAAGDASLSFEGPRLSMADKRVWEALVRIAKRDRIDASEPFDVRLSEVARLAGYGQGQSRAAWASIERLARAKLDATVYGAKACGWLLMSCDRSGRMARVRFDLGFIEPALSQTMQASMKGAAGDGVRSLLGQWLRDYFSTHKPPAKSLTLDYLRDLSGYTSQPKHFVAALETAMAELTSDRPDLVASWSIDKSESVGNASDRWTLLAIRGPAMPVVRHPPKPAPVEPPAPPFPSKRRGRPCL